MNGFFFLDVKEELKQVFDAGELDARNETGLAEVFEW